MPMNETDNIVLITFMNSYGNYSWCGNGYDGSKTGYHLSTTSGGLCDYKDKRLLLNITVIMNQSLSSQIDVIEIYDVTGYLAQYSIDLDSRYYAFRFPVNLNLAGTGLKFLFRKIIDLPNPLRLGRPPMTTIYETSILIPELTVYGDKKTCSICLEEPTDGNKYITACGHLFCMKCIFEYFEKNNLLIENPKRCVEWNHGHSAKPKQFRCPVCDKKVIP